MKNLILILLIGLFSFKEADNFIISANQVSQFKKGMSIEKAISLFPKEQVKLTKGHGEFEYEVYDDYEFYDEKGKLLLTLTPKDGLINRILILIML